MHIKKVIPMVACAAALTLGAGTATATGWGHHHRHHSIPEHLFVAPGNQDAYQQIFNLWEEGNYKDAFQIQAMVNTPTAQWFNGASTPEQVEQEVAQTMWAAKWQFGATPVLVAYNLPFRDCAQFSAGGATNLDEYLAWMDGFAAGIGDGKAIVILEPDGLGIIPHYTPIANDSPEWCQPEEADAETAADERFSMMNGAVDRLMEQPNVKVYLDGTHSGWLGVGDVSDRLVKAGVQRAMGFYLNASNYQSTEKLVKYGEWISSCIAYGTNEDEGGWRVGNFDWCASQYYPADPNDFSTWALTDEWYTDNMGSSVATSTYVIDTSRNGQGPWVPGDDLPEGDKQDWCNPPDRGLGLKPSLNTGIDLLDAYLWIKVPGESDGECNRWEPFGSQDPVRGVYDPAAGQWFEDMALELLDNAEEGFHWPWFGWGWGHHRR